MKEASTALSAKSPTKATLTSETMQHGRSTPAPSRSPRKDKYSISLSGTDITHIVWVTVLGLAGVTVDQSKCKEISKDSPALPSRMRSVMALSRNSASRGTITSSKPLVRSPYDNIIMTGSSVKSSKVKDDEMYTTSTVGPTRPERNVPVWASENATLGDRKSVV